MATCQAVLVKVMCTLSRTKSGKIGNGVPRNHAQSSDRLLHTMTRLIALFSAALGIGFRSEGTCHCRDRRGRTFRYRVVCGYGYGREGDAAAL